MQNVHIRFRDSIKTLKFKYFCSVFFSVFHSVVFDHQRKNGNQIFPLESNCVLDLPLLLRVGESNGFHLVLYNFSCFYFGWKLSFTVVSIDGAAAAAAAAACRRWRFNWSTCTSFRKQKIQSAKKAKHRVFARTDSHRGISTRLICWFWRDKLSTTRKCAN